MAWYGAAIRTTMLVLPVFVLLALASALSVGLWASALNVRYRDVQYLMPFVIQFWLFASPVAYSTSLITSPWWRVVYGLNPMAGIIQGFRLSLLGSEPRTYSRMLTDADFRTPYQPSDLIREVQPSFGHSQQMTFIF